MALRDMLNQPLTVGDIVAYPGRIGSSMWMSIGKILAFGDFYENYKIKIQSIIEVNPDVRYELARPTWVNGQTMCRMIKLTYDQALMAPPALRNVLFSIAPKNSSVILSAKFDGINTVIINFKDKETGELARSYQYNNFPVTLWKEFVGAQSKGTFFASRIRNNKDLKTRKLPAMKKAGN